MDYNINLNKYNYDKIKHAINNIKDNNNIIGQSGVIEGHAYHLYIIEVEDRLGLYNYLRKNNILAQIHYIPCHLMPYYRQFGWKEGDFDATAANR